MAYVLLCHNATVVLKRVMSRLIGNDHVDTGGFWRGKDRYFVVRALSSDRRRKGRGQYVANIE